MQAVGSYRARKFFIPLMIMAYAVVAALFRPANDVEFYPFFNWNLFSDAKSPMWRAELEVHSLDGNELAQPLTYYQMGDTFAVAARRNTAAAKAFKRLGNAISSGDQELQQTMRAIVEDTYLREAEQVRYDIVAVQFDPIERYETGAIIDRVVLGSFDKR